MESNNTGGSQQAGKSRSTANREKAGEAGQKSDPHSRLGSGHAGEQGSGGSQRGGSGSFAQNQDKASEAGKKGGEPSHGG